MALHGSLAWNAGSVCGGRLRSENLVYIRQRPFITNFEVLAVLASSWLLAQIVPFFSDLVNLLGSTFTPTIAFMTPMFLYLLLARVQDRLCQSSTCIASLSS